jgi:ABC-2 type transport system ATP-binding protein
VSGREQLVIIEAQGLRKTFRVRRRGRRETVEALRGVDLGVKGGEIFGLLGPNGAGKTTLLRMLATLLPLDGGQATVAGVDLLRSPGTVRKRIGYVAQGGGTSDDLTAREELFMQARMYGIARADARARTDAALDSFQLREFSDRRCKTYSGGQRRRLDIALGIIHAPQLVFLDEPTTGLDPQSRARLWDEVRRLRDTGISVFLTTHYLEEADALCDRVAIIDYGTLVAEGTPDELKRAISGDVITAQLAEVPGVTEARVHAGERVVARWVDPVTHAAALLETAPYVRKLEKLECGFRVHVDAASTAVPRILRVLSDAHLAIESINVHRPSLDDVFLAKTGRSLREE